MQGPAFKFYIKNLDGQYYWVDELDTVQISFDPVPIVNAPKNWMDMLAGYVHNEKRKGNFTKITTPNQFVGDGRRIINYIFFYEGAQGFANFVIHKQVADDFSYELFFDGTIDFQEYKYGEHYSTANVRETGLLDIIEAKESVVYDIPLTAENSGDVQEDGINLHYKTLSSVTNGFGTGSAWDTGDHIVELIEASSENPYSLPTVRTKYSNHPADAFATNQPFYRTPVRGRANISFDFKVFVRWTTAAPVPGPASALRYDIVKKKTDGSFENNIIYQVLGQDAVFSISYQSGKEHHIVNNVTIDLQPGDELYLCCNPSGMTLSGQAAQFTYQGQPTDFIIDTVQRAPATLHKFIRPYKLWQELLNKATDGRYSGISPYLIANNNLILIPGSSLRKDAVVSIKTTLADFLKFCYVNMLGVVTDVAGLNGEIKNIADTFINTESTNLGEVADLQVYHSKEHTVGTIKVGYENIDFGVDGQVNGKDEFNQTSHFTTGQDKIKAEYDIVSPYIASMYAHELMRVQFGSRKTTDNKGDNKVYLLDAEQGTDVHYYNGNFETIASNQIKIPVVLTALTNGSEIVLIDTLSNAGTYTIVSTSLATPGYTIITVVEAVTTATLAGIITYFDSLVYKPRRPVFATVAGLLDPETAFNIEVSPKHLLLFHSPIISGGVYNSNINTAINTIRFQSQDKNSLLSVSIDNILFISENTDEQISLLQQPYYLPIKFEFKTDYRPDIFSFLRGVRRYHYIGFTWKGKTYGGYIIDVDSNPDGNKPQTFILVSLPTTNILNLI